MPLEQTFIGVTDKQRVRQQVRYAPCPTGYMAGQHVTGMPCCAVKRWAMPTVTRKDRRDSVTVDDLLALQAFRATGTEIKEKRGDREAWEPAIYVRV